MSQGTFYVLCKLVMSWDFQNKSEGMIFLILIDEEAETRNIDQYFFHSGITFETLNLEEAI